MLFALGWLLTKRCRLSILQLMAAVMTYGLALAGLQEWLKAFSSDPKGKFAPFAICLGLSVVLGIFTGSRIAICIPKEQSWQRWLFFLAGLWWPLATPLALACLLVGFTPHAFLSIGERLVLFSLFSASPLLTTYSFFHYYAKAQERMKSPSDLPQT